MTDIALQVAPNAAGGAIQLAVGDSMRVLAQTVDSVKKLAADAPPEAKITALNAAKKALVEGSGKFAKFMIDGLDLAQTYCPKQTEWFLTPFKQMAQGLADSSQVAVENIDKCVSENKIQEALCHAQESLQGQVDKMRTWMDTCTIAVAVISLGLAIKSLLCARLHQRCGDS